MKQLANKYIIAIIFNSFILSHCDKFTQILTEIGGFHIVDNILYL